MALWFNLKVNTETIGWFEAQRQEEAVTGTDQVSKYDVVIALDKDSEALTELTVEHRYGDGAWVLVHKALTAYLATQQPPEIEVPASEEVTREMYWRKVRGTD